MSRMINEALETMRGLHGIGLVNKQTLRDFETQCLPQTPDYTAEMIQRLRENLNISQAVFAAYLNASISTVQKWENGDKNLPAMPKPQFKILFVCMCYVCRIPMIEVVFKKS